MTTNLFAVIGQPHGSHWPLLSEKKMNDSENFIDDVSELIQFKQPIEVRDFGFGKMLNVNNGMFFPANVPDSQEITERDKQRFRNEVKKSHRQFQKKNPHFTIGIRFIAERRGFVVYRKT